MSNARIAGWIAGIAPDCKSAKRGSPTRVGKWGVGTAHTSPKPSPEWWREAVKQVVLSAVDTLCVLIGSRVGIRPSVHFLDGT